MFPGWTYDEIMKRSFKELYVLRDIRAKRKTEERKAQEREQNHLEKMRENQRVYKPFSKKK